ncbi:MAG: HAMP domain-containing histidine kinase [Proteobacteria bacterium]|uniref:sensor histidine kinase n=1 Tax=Rudaea sp. TaxID=2136325 RepID=UPI001DA8F0D2|nr:HAMP domain-containing histidine kinase [Pseudomonadota bacterium]MBS0566774.1 HAMP domain-containing histidine kinase [Pseudomonadota bacterium]
MFAELWRITSFRLTVLYGGLFALAVVGLFALIYWQTARYQNQQVDQILLNQVHVFSTATADQLDDDIAYEIARDIRRIGFFGVFAADGKALAGNLARIPQGLILNGKPRALPVERNDDLFPQALEVRALGRTLDDGRVLVVARDVALLEQIRQSLLRGCFLIAAVILLLGVLGGVFYSLPAVRHIRDIDRAARRIADGDYSQRLPLGRRNRELDVLAQIVNAMLDETERLMGEVKTASDNIAHDLRTPLTRLRASIYRTQQSMDKTSLHRDALNHALTQTDLLLTRFRALSRISEIESKRRRAGISPTFLEPVLRTLTELYEPLANRGGVKLSLRIESSPSAVCDGELLFEAIGNLLDNAIKFTPAGGVVCVTLGGTQAEPVISVSDSGPGIPPDLRKSVLHRFFRADDARNTPGSGLGLSLVDAIVRLHGFGLVLDDAPEGGLRARMSCWQRRMPG